MRSTCCCTCLYRRRAGILPGENVEQVKYQAAHHELVASAKAVKLAHENAGRHGGLYAGGRAVLPTPAPPEDVRAAQEADRDNYFFTDVQSAGRLPRCGLKADGAGITSSEPGDDRTLQEGTVDFVSFSYYSSRCITTDKEILAGKRPTATR